MYRILRSKRDADTVAAGASFLVHSSVLYPEDSRCIVFAYIVEYEYGVVQEHVQNSCLWNRERVPTADRNKVNIFFQSPIYVHVRIRMISS